MVIFAIHQYESAMGVNMSPHPESPSHVPPHSIALGCPRAPALNALCHASNLHWSSILYKVIYMFQYYSLKSSHPCLLQQSSEEQTGWITNYYHIRELLSILFFPTLIEQISSFFL